MSNVEFTNTLVNHSDFLRPYAVTLTKDLELAKDLYQETIFKALANKDKYNMGTNVKAWLYTIMRNIFINDYRRKAKQNTFLTATTNEALANYKTTVTTNDGVATLNMKEVQAAIHSLPFIFKQPFMLFFEGYKYHEIAKALNEPLGTIKSRIHFARKLLKEQIERP
jgi:RNA polymerase sigma factor (sigma-70 family)